MSDFIANLIRRHETSTTSTDQSFSVVRPRPVSRFETAHCYSETQYSAEQADNTHAEPNSLRSTTPQQQATLASDNTAQGIPNSRDESLPASETIKPLLHPQQKGQKPKKAPFIPAAHAETTASTEAFLTEQDAWQPTHETLANTSLSQVDSHLIASNTEQQSNTPSHTAGVNSATQLDDNFSLAINAQSPTLPVDTNPQPAALQAISAQHFTMANLQSQLNLSLLAEETTHTERSAAPQDINITIGQIEIRAAAPTLHTPQTKRDPASGIMNLNDYLTLRTQQKKGGKS